MPLHATGPNIESLTTYNDYKPVAGVLFPHSFVERNTATGVVMNTLRWNRIEANIKIDDRQFSPPQSKSQHLRNCLCLSQRGLPAEQALKTAQLASSERKLEKDL